MCRLLPGFLGMGITCCKFTPSEAGAPFEVAPECWKVHELILEIIKPRAIITFGRKPFDFVSVKLGASNFCEIRADHSTWTCRAARDKNGRVLIGLPHLSPYALRYKPEVLKWVVELVGQA